MSEKQVAVRLNRDEWADVVACIELQRRKDATSEQANQHWNLAIDIIRQVQL